MHKIGRKITLRAGTDFKKLFAKYKNGVLVNYGGAVSHVRLRYGAGIYDAYQNPTSEEVKQMVDMAKQAIEDGALGIAFSLEYMPGTTHEEAYELFRLAKEYNVLCTVLCFLEGIELRRFSIVDRSSFMDVFSRVISDFILSEYG